MALKRYEIVLNDLLAQIESGKYKNDDMLPMESELVEIYDVSRITIQKAMNILVTRGIVYRIPGKGTFVKEASKVAVKQTDNQFYAIITPFQQPETLKVIQGAQTVMAENNECLTVHFTDYNGENEPEIINDLIAKGARGIIMYTWQSESNVEFYSKLQKSSYPIVFIDKNVNRLTTNLVVSDNFDGAYQATEHFINNGHTSIGFFSFQFRWGTSLKDRFDGYYQCLKDHNIELDDKKVQSNVIDELDVDRAANEFFSQNKDCTAIFCTTDHMANKLYSWCYQHNVSIPEQLSIIGFDNDSYATSMYPPLTTIAQNFEAIGTEAANLILQMKQDSTKSKKMIIIPTNLVERDSVKKINK